MIRARENTASNLAYWNELLLKDQLPRIRSHRYLTFDVDIGGLNNIRLTFEYAVVLAAITGRTLVLPPAESWYLINRGPIVLGEQGGTTDFGDLFDLQALGAGLRILDTNEFIQEAQEHLNIPKQFRAANAFSGDSSTTVTDWKRWLLQLGVDPGWIPYHTLICFPTIEQARRGPHLTEEYIDGRRLVELSPWMNAAPVLHLPSNDTSRSLGPVATMLASEQRDLPMLGRRLVKHHVRYRLEIFQAAEAIINALGFRQYDALHVRRNDFQYPETQLAVREIADNTRRILNPDTPLYIATDEDQEEFFDQMRRQYPGKQTVRWMDVRGKVAGELPPAWIGPVEQLICVGADNFAGTDLSTFTTYIHRLRGYLAPENETCFYHTVKESNQYRADGQYRFGGSEYLRENPLYWTSC